MVEAVARAMIHGSMALVSEAIAVITGTMALVSEAISMTVAVITVIGGHVQIRVAVGVLSVLGTSMLSIVLMVMSRREMMLSIHVGVLVTRHVLGRLVVDGTTVGLVLKLNMRLLLMILVVIVAVGNVRLLVVYGVVMDDAGLVVMMHVLVMVDALVVDDLVMHGRLNMESAMLTALDAMA